MVAAFLRRLITGGAEPTRRPRSTGRVTGPPTSSNGASSMHLFWQVPPTPLIEVTADLEIVQPPVVDKLYFWALQVSFVGDNVDRGGAHTGLQHHPAYPANGAVNWGGYHPGGGQLDGSQSALPSALDNVNTRDYRWEPEQTYRFRVFKPAESRWRATVADLATGDTTVIRDLFVEADHLVRPMVWSEVFADCDHPPVTVRWSNLTATTAERAMVSVLSVRTNYQSHGDGGCANTNSTLDDNQQGFLQKTNTVRTSGGGSLLTLP